MKKMVKSALVGLTVFSLVGCQMSLVKDRHIRKSFNQVVRHFEDDAETSPTAENQNVIEAALEIRASIQKSKDIIKRPPKLEGQLSEDVAESKIFVEKNREKINKYFSDIENSLGDVVAIVHDLGEANNLTDASGQNHLLSAQERAKNESMIFFALQFMRNAARDSMGLIMPFTLGTYAKSFQNDDFMTEFRSEIFKKYMAITGLSIIAQKDIRKTLKNLAGYRKEGALPDYLNEEIGTVLENVSKKESDAAKSVNHAVDELESEQLAQFNEMKTEFLKAFEGKSLLYDPANPDNIPVILFTWIGNLTWGGINTMIGLGWVVGTALVSPFTRYVDFPTIKISRSGTQIYADVSGTLLFSGKISLGLFELDHNAGWNFASAHEAGHSTQSALLGPFYLPVVFLSYALNMGHGGFIENWADTWAHFHDDRW